MSGTDAIRWDAAQWIARRMDNDPFDEDAFNIWLSSDPRCRSVFDAMWRRTMGSQMDAALGSYERRGASRRTWLASGMAVLLVVACGYTAMPLVELHLASPQDYAVADGTVRKVILADGTQLALGGGAEVRVRYTRHERVVELAHGTIFATVAHDEERPFRVEAGNARIVDLGTSFEVSSKPASVRVMVASGIVEFGNDGWLSKPINMTASQAAILDRRGLNRIADVDPNDVARWRGEWVEYKGAPLQQVIADLQSLSPVPIELKDESLMTRPVSGRMRLTDPVGQLQNLSIIHAFQVRRTDDALVISKD